MSDLKTQQEGSSPGQDFSWRLIESAAANGARNMAIDVSLAESVRKGGPPVLRFYRWEPPCISLGRNQPARDHYDAEAAERWGIDFVRRPTGGGAVYHHREITYSVMVGDRLLGGPRRTYHLIHRGLLAGLRLLGAPVDMVGVSAEPHRPSTVPCFRELDLGAIVADKQKLVGSAQLRERGVILQHGSIMLAGDQQPTVALLKVQREADAAAQSTAASLNDLLDSLPTWHEIVDALASGLERVLAMHLDRSVLSDAENARVAEAVRLFSDPEWTWRY